MQFLRGFDFLKAHRFGQARRNTVMYNRYILTFIAKDALRILTSFLTDSYQMGGILVIEATHKVIDMKCRNKFTP